MVPGGTGVMVCPSSLYDVHGVFTGVSKLRVLFDRLSLPSNRCVSSRRRVGLSTCDWFVASAPESMLEACLDSIPGAIAVRGGSTGERIALDFSGGSAAPSPVSVCSGSGAGAGTPCGGKLLNVAGLLVVLHDDSLSVEINFLCIGSIHTWSGLFQRALMSSQWIH